MNLTQLLFLIPSLVIVIVLIFFIGQRDVGMSIIVTTIGLIIHIIFMSLFIEVYIKAVKKDEQ